MNGPPTLETFAIGTQQQASQGPPDGAAVASELDMDGWQVCFVCVCVQACSLCL